MSLLLLLLSLLSLPSLLLVGGTSYPFCDALDFGAHHVHFPIAFDGMLCWVLSGVDDGGFLIFGVGLPS